MKPSSRTLLKSAARAPVRIDPAGGGTDAPPYSLEYGGVIVNFAVARYSYATLQLLPPGSGAHLHSLDFQESAHAPSTQSLQPNGGKLDFLKGFARRLLTGHNDFLLLTHSDVPVRTGLGGSGAMGVAITAACLHATERPIDQCAVAHLANEIERVDLAHAGGCQDSYGAAVGGAKKITCHQGGGVSCHPLRLPPGIVQRLERDLLLIYTGGIHLSGTIHTDIKRSYAMKNSPTIAAMDRLRAAALSMADALESGDFPAFIDALNTSRVSHYALHDSCDSPTLRTYFEKLSPHILGGKTCGAGGGGFIAVLTKPGHKHACTAAAQSLGGEVWPFNMDHSGVTAWPEPAWSPDELSYFQSRASS